MARLGYTKEWDPDTTSRAMGRELGISPKKSVEVCRALSGMMIEDAKELLENVIAGKVAISYRVHDEAAHKRNAYPKNGPGGYPKNVARAILKVIEGAQENAEFKGLDSERMRIVTIAAHRGSITKGQMQRAHGRAGPWNEQTTNIEVVLKEEEE